MPFDAAGVLRRSAGAEADQLSSELDDAVVRGTPLGVAVIGLGYWGPNLLRVLADNPDVEVRWICDLDRDRLEQFRRRYPAARITTSIERVLADPDVDAVIIATPVHTHYDLAAQALEAGKHTFVEKPLAPSSELADDLVELAPRPRPHADVRPHVHLQPAGARGQAAARGRDARRHLLHLVEPGEPRAAPARRERDLGSRRRTTSRSSCTG